MLILFGIHSSANSPLRTLYIREEHRLDGRDHITLQDLRCLHQECPDLENLEIDLPYFPHRNVRGYLDRSQFDAQGFIDLLPYFSRLKTLRLWAQNDHGMPFYEKTGISSTDVDYDDSANIMKTLHLSKHGNAFETIKITLWNSKRPLNCQPSPGVSEDDPAYTWTSRRTFCTRRTLTGRIQSWIEEGEGRFTNESKDQQQIEEGSAGGMEANVSGDAIITHGLPLLLKQGAPVMLGHLTDEERAQLGGEDGRHLMFGAKHFLMLGPNEPKSLDIRL